MIATSPFDHALPVLAAGALICVIVAGFAGDADELEVQIQGQA